MINVLITGHGGSYNKGCEAILRSTVDIIQRYIEQASITVLSFDPASDRTALMPDFKKLRIPDVSGIAPKRYSFGWVASRFDKRVLRSAIPGLLSYFSFVNRSLYRNKDVIISIGGDNFTDDYGNPSQFFGELAYAKSLGALTVIWGASIGPFSNKKLEKRWIERLKSVDLITVREPETLDYLDKIGIKENVKFVADPAFLLPCSKRGVIPLSPFKSKKVIGIGMSSIIARYGSSEEKYLESFASFGKFLLSDANTHLFLVPHVVKKGEGYGDDLVCQRLAARLLSDKHVTVISSKYNASQIKYIISQCDYFIGARTHSTIASLSSYIPTLSIAYGTKAYGINKAIFEHTKYVLSIADLNKKSLMEKFTLLCNKRPDIVRHLQCRVPEIKELANQGGIHLREMIERHGYRAYL